MSIPIAKCPNDECIFFKETGKRYEWPLKKKTLKVKFRICPKCKKIFTV